MGAWIEIIAGPVVGLIVVTVVVYISRKFRLGNSAKKKTEGGGDDC